MSERKKRAWAKKGSRWCSWLTYFLTCRFFYSFCLQLPPHYSCIVMTEGQESQWLSRSSIWKAPRMRSMTSNKKSTSFLNWTRPMSPGMYTFGHYCNPFLCFFLSPKAMCAREWRRREERGKEPNVPLATRPDAALLYHVARSLDGEIFHPQRRRRKQARKNELTPPLLLNTLSSCWF